MLFKIGIVLLLVWLPGALGFYTVGKLVHLLLMTGLFMLLLGVAKPRDAAPGRGVDSVDKE